MRESVLYRKKLFIENKDTLCETFRMTNRNILLYVAYSASASGRRIDGVAVKECRRLIEERIAWHSTLRGTSLVPLSYMLSGRADREGVIDELSGAIELLKKNKFHSSDERALCAKILVENVDKFDCERVAERARRIYLEIRDNHPFLTSYDDYPYALLMALSEKDDTTLVSGCEAAYAILKPELGAYNSTQALSHIFAMCDDPREESRRFLSLHEAMKAQRCKFYTGSIEMAAMGALSVGDRREPGLIAAEIREMSEALKREKHFGGVFATVTRAQRLMYSCMLISEPSENKSGLSDAVNMGAVIAQIAAETTAMVSTIVTVNAANSASN